MRLDKYLCELNIGTRSQARDYIRQGLVTINGSTAQKPEQQVREDVDLVTFRNQPLSFRKYVYYMLNKPQGVVSATRDNTATTVLELLPAANHRDLFPVGRLDKDTEGLLLITNDGALSHKLLSPRKHVDKTYVVGTRASLSPEALRVLEKGVDIGDEKPTAPAKAELLPDGKLLLTIHEGRFHQVKRMLQAVDNEVLTLKRIRFGGLFLDEGLAPGESRELTNEEVAILHEA